MCSVKPQSTSLGSIFPQRFLNIISFPPTHFLPASLFPITNNYIGEDNDTSLDSNIVSTNPLAYHSNFSKADNIVI